MESRTAAPDPKPVKSGTTQDGFTQVKSRKRNRAHGQANPKKDVPQKEIRSKNAFETLEGMEEEGMPQEKERVDRPTETPSVREEAEAQQMEIVEDDADEEMELGELDLDAIEEECGKKGKGYVSRRQIELLQAAIIKARAHPKLGIDPDPQTGHKRKPMEEEQRRGRKSNKQRIAEVGIKLIESGQYPTIREAFSEVSNSAQ